MSTAVCLWLNYTAICYLSIYLSIYPSVYNNWLEIDFKITPDGNHIKLSFKNKEMTLD